MNRPKIVLAKKLSLQEVWNLWCAVQAINKSSALGILWLFSYFIVIVGFSRKSLQEISNLWQICQISMHLRFFPHLTSAIKCFYLVNRSESRAHKSRYLGCTCRHLFSHRFTLRQLIWKIHCPVFVPLQRDRFLKNFPKNTLDIKPQKVANSTEVIQ